MKWLTCKLTSWLIDMHVVSKEERELYEFAAYCFFITIAPLMLSILLGVLMGFAIESIVIIIPFMMIRKFSGGYHMKKPISCFATSCFLLIFCIILSSNLIYDAKIVNLLLLSSASLMIFSPIDSGNRRLEHYEKQRYKKITCAFTIVFVSLFFIFACIKCHTLANCIAIGIILTAGLQLPCIIINTFQTLKKIAY